MAYQTACSLRGFSIYGYIPPTTGITDNLFCPVCVLLLCLVSGALARLTLLLILGFELHYTGAFHRTYHTINHN